MSHNGIVVVYIYGEKEVNAGVEQSVARRAKRRRVWDVIFCWADEIIGWGYEGKALLVKYGMVHGIGVGYIQGCYKYPPM